MVEFALVLPVLLLILLAIIEFGFVFGSYLELTHLVRDGCRWGVVQDRTDTQIKTQMRNGAVMLNKTELYNRIVIDRSVANQLTVRVDDYPARALTSMFGELFRAINPGGAYLKLDASCTMKIE